MWQLEGEVKRRNVVWKRPVFHILLSSFCLFLVRYDPPCFNLLVLSRKRILFSHKGHSREQLYDVMGSVRLGRSVIREYEVELNCSLVIFAVQCCRFNIHANVPLGNAIGPATSALFSFPYRS